MEYQGGLGSTHRYTCGFLYEGSEDWTRVLVHTKLSATELSALPQQILNTEVDLQQ